MHRPNAFTLIELLVVIAVLAALVLVLTLGVGRVKSATANAKCVLNLKTIGAATLQYGYDNNGHFLPHANYAFWESSGTERIRKAKWHWMTHLSPYLGSPDATGPMSSVFNCPSDPEVPNWPVNRPWVPASSGDASHTLSSYGYNYYYLTTTWSWWPPDREDKPINLKTVSRPNNLLVFADGPENGGSIIYFTEKNNPAPRHGKRFNAVFLDGHVESLGKDVVKTAKPYFKPE